MLNSCLFRLNSILIGIGVFIASILLMIVAPVKYTETTDLADYGEFTGTGSKSFVENYINSIFPQSIDESFTNVSYSFKAENIDTYGFEAYLEFSIEDTEEFNRYIDAIKQEYSFQDFPYDSSFQECKIEDVFVLFTDTDYDPTSIPHYQITQAKIRKILYSKESQTIIYVAMGVYDGGGAGTDYLNVFFNRFGIDPVEYEQNADSMYGVDPYGIGD